MAEAPQKPTPSEESPNLDALSASEASGVVDAIDRHRTKILAAIAISAIVFCGILIGAQVKKQKHLEAAAAYTSAVSKGEIAALDGVLVDFPGSIPAGNALLSKADLQIDQGKPEDARATLERFVSEFKSHPRYPQGLFAMANVYHTSGDGEKAKSFYEQVITAQPDGELTPLARIRLGDLALEAGDTKTADQRYQESYTLHSGNPFFEYAEEKIALLKSALPPRSRSPLLRHRPHLLQPKLRRPRLRLRQLPLPLRLPPLLPQSLRLLLRRHRRSPLRRKPPGSDACACACSGRTGETRNSQSSDAGTGTHTREARGTQDGNSCSCSCSCSCSAQ